MEKSKSSPDSFASQQQPRLARLIHNSVDLRRVFAKYDSNGDRRISPSDLESMLVSLGSSNAAAEARSMMDAADLDGDGFISVEEFLKVNAEETDGKRCMEELRSAFEVFDENKDGVISAEELHRVLQSMGDEASLGDCRSMIEGVNGSGGAGVDFHRFLLMMTRSSSANKKEMLPKSA
ncbi:hypothetical protein ACLOJK_023249 [Asimina triloba]